MNAPRRAAAIVAACLLGPLLAACGSAPRYAQSGPVSRQGRYVVGAPYEENGVWYFPKVDYHYDRTGIASWYGPSYNLKPTANGEIFNMDVPSAAHPTLPLPSIVRVTNLANGRSLELRVNDRGPFVDGRIIDVSREAAHLLGFETAGTAPVRVKLMKQQSIEAADLAMHNEIGPFLADNATGPSLAAAAAPPAAEAAALDAAPAATPPEPRVIAAAAPSPARGFAEPQSQRLAAAAPLPGDIPPVSAAVSPVPTAAPARIYSSVPASPARLAAARRTPRPARRPVMTAAAAPPRRPWFSMPALVPAAAAAELPNSAHWAAAARSSDARRFFVQAGAFSLPVNAERVKMRIASLGDVEVVRALVNGVEFYRVRLGPISSFGEARRMLIQIIGSGFPAARIVAD